MLINITLKKQVHWKWNIFTSFNSKNYPFWELERAELGSFLRYSGKCISVPPHATRNTPNAQILMARNLTPCMEHPNFGNTSHFTRHVGCCYLLEMACPAHCLLMRCISGHIDIDSPRRHLQLIVRFSTSATDDGAFRVSSLEYAFCRRTADSWTCHATVFDSRWRRFYVSAESS